VVAEGNFVGRLIFQGAGAGEGPTASAVVADLIDIAREEFGSPYAMPAAALASLPRADISDRRGRAYLRFTVQDRVGVLAEIAAAMRDAAVSIESLIQRAVTADGSAIVAIVTHEGPERAVAQALEALRDSPSLVGQPLWMHILE
jgi:homoserine dehydrogenase